jgi:hypothetical protein
MCKRNGELVDHLLLLCDVASASWSAFLVVLGCPGLYLEVLLICLTVGGPMAGLGVRRCGKWCLHVSSDVYGRKGM